jgi:hypothetical protein
MERMKNLQYANKPLGDLKPLCRFNEVAELMQALQNLPQDHLINQHPAYRALNKRGYMRIPRVVAITPVEASPQFGDADFSPEAIGKAGEAGACRSPQGLVRSASGPVRSTER